MNEVHFHAVSHSIHTKYSIWKIDLRRRIGFMISVVQFNGKVNNWNQIDYNFLPMKMDTVETFTSGIESENKLPSMLLFRSWKYFLSMDCVKFNAIYSFFVCVFTFTFNWRIRFIFQGIMGFLWIRETSFKLWIVRSDTCDSFIRLLNIAIRFSWMSYQSKSIKT